MLFCECGSAGGDGGVNTGQVARHHIGVAFDNDDLLLLADWCFGKVDSVEHFVLVVDRRIGTVVILWTLIGFEQLAGTKTDHGTALIMNRPHEASAIKVIHPTGFLALSHQSGIQQLLIGEPHGLEVIG